MPNAIAQNLQRLATARNDIATAITDMGGTVTLGDGFEEFPADIRTILPTKVEHYSFKIDKSKTGSSDAIVYTGTTVGMMPAKMDFTKGEFDYGDWGNAFFMKGFYPCMLRYDGTEDYKLDPNDYSKKLDGTPSDVANVEYEGNAMIAFPTVWIKRSEDTNFNYYDVANYPLDSEYQAYAHTDAMGTILPKIYLPIYKGRIVDGKLRSLSGLNPQGSTTAQTEINTAVACGAGWSIWDFSTKEMLCDLLTLIGKNADSQATFGKGQESGYNAEDTTNHGKIFNGTLDDKGLWFGYNSSTSQVKVFGLEGLWGCRHDRELGLVLVDGVYMVKPIPPYNLTGAEYESCGQSPTSNNYVKTLMSTKYGSLPVTVSASGSSPFKDYFYQSQSSTRVAIRGGNCGDGAGCGYRYVYVNGAASFSYWSVGSSPVYK